MRNIPRCERWWYQGNSWLSRGSVVWVSWIADSVLSEPQVSGESDTILERPQLTIANLKKASRWQITYSVLSLMSPISWKVPEIWAWGGGCHGNLQEDVLGHAENKTFEDHHPFFTESSCSTSAMHFVLFDYPDSFQPGLPTLFQPTPPLMFSFY